MFYQTNLVWYLLSGSSHLPSRLYLCCFSGISRVNPLKPRIITYLVSGMSHQVSCCQSRWTKCLQGVFAGWLLDCCHSANMEICAITGLSKDKDSTISVPKINIHQKCTRNQHISTTMFTHFWWSRQLLEIFMDVHKLWTIPIVDCSFCLIRLFCATTCC